MDLVVASVHSQLLDWATAHWIFLYTIGNLIGSVITGLLAGYACRNRDSPAATALAVLTTAGCLWTASVVVQNVSDTYLMSRIGIQIGYVGITMAAAAWLAFSLALSHREEWLTRKTAVALAVEPILVNVLGITNEFHNLFWASLEWDPTAVNGVTSQFGPFFWVHTVYTYLLLVAGTVFLLEHVLRSRNVYRWQTIAVLVGVGGPWTGSIVFLTNIVPVDFGPIGFVVAGVSLTWAIFRYRLTDLAPVARDRVVETIGDPVFVLDSDERVVDINQAGRHHFGLEDDQNVIGEQASDVFADHSVLFERYRDVYSAEDEVQLMIDSEPKEYEIEISSVYSAGDRPVGRLFLLHDITDQKHRQRELERQNEQLEQFASVVSHDLRNPLNVANGYVQIARDKYEDDEVIDEIAQSHDRMETIIEDVLALAREGEEIDEFEPVDLPGAAREAWENVDTKDATFECTVEETIAADSTRLSRIFENLFRNALDHGPDDATLSVGSIEMESDDTLATGVEYGVYVADDGPGIPDDQQDEVLEAGHTTAEDGTGLGLSIVQSIVEAHGWEIAVAESESGGARFDITGVQTMSGPGGESETGGRDGIQNARPETTDESVTDEPEATEEPADAEETRTERPID
jgi:signal transduction histidine kinase